MKALRTLISDWLFWLARKVKPRRKPGPPRGYKRTPKPPAATVDDTAPVVDAESTPNEGGAT